MLSVVLRSRRAQACSVTSSSRLCLSSSNLTAQGCKCQSDEQTHSTPLNQNVLVLSSLLAIPHAVACSLQSTSNARVHSLLRTSSSSRMRQTILPTARQASTSRTPPPVPACSVQSSPQTRHARVRTEQSVTQDLRSELTHLVEAGPAHRSQSVTCRIKRRRPSTASARTRMTSRRCDRPSVARRRRRRAIS